MSANVSPKDNQELAYATIEVVRQDVNILLEQVFAERKKAASIMSERYEALWQATETYVLAGGKRIRPYLTILGYQLFGGTDYHKIIYVATAQEMLHQALLIHDDIIDRDYMRYGIPNVAGQFRAYYKQERGYSSEQSRHYADAAALLAGDVSIAEAFMLVRQAGLSAEQTLGLQSYLHEAIVSVAGGEFLDSETYNGDIETTDVLSIIHNKTAVYSVVVPLLSGAYLTDASDADMVALRLFGEKLGAAYQLADDILGVFGNGDVTGKSTISDLREGKHTFMMQQTWKRATADQRNTLEQFFGKEDLNENKAEIIRQIIVACGAKDECDVRIKHLVDDAIAQLDVVNADEAGKQLLREFSYAATRRNK